MTNLELFLESTKIRKEKISLRIIKYSESWIHFVLDKSLEKVCSNIGVPRSLFDEKVRKAVIRFCVRTLCLKEDQFKCYLFDKKILVKATEGVTLDKTLIDEELAQSFSRGFNIHYEI